jgi:hypothetical protein
MRHQIPVAPLEGLVTKPSPSCTSQTVVMAAKCCVQHGGGLRTCHGLGVLLPPGASEGCSCSEP